MIGKTELNAVRALAALAGRPHGRSSGAAAIAERIDAPPNYLGKLLRGMVRDGLVESQKGPGGGFRLARDARRIRLLDVVESTEQITRRDGCFLGFPECSEEQPCAVHPRWKRLRNDYLAMLAETTIADLVSSERTQDASMTQPTKVLMNEHRLIEQVLTCLERMAERCESSGELDAQLARDAVWFLRTYADRCHHGKEEAELFPLLESRGLSPDAGPTAVMRAEHVEGRELVGRIEAAIERDARDFVRSALEFVSLVRAHIQKEDHCLFPAADQMLTDAERDELGQRFDQVDYNEIGRDVIEKCRRTANELADRIGVPRA